MMQDPTIGRLHLTLDREAIRAAVTGANIANVDTPGFRALRARLPLPGDFGRTLEIARTSPLHKTGQALAAGVQVAQAEVTRARPDGNTVDIDREMTLLAKISGRYTTTTQLVKKRFALLQYAATNGGRP